MQPDHAATISHLHPDARAWRVWLAWLLCGAVVALFGGGVALTVGMQRASYTNVLGPAYGLACALAGGFIINRRARNLVGWLLLLAGLGVSGGFAALQYGRYGAVFAPGSLPWPRTIAWAATILIPLGTGLTVTVLPLVFPNGRLISPRWRLAAWLVLIVVLIVTGVNATRNGPMQDQAGVPNPFAVRLPAPWDALAGATVGYAGLAAVLLCAASVVVRYRRASDDERMQLKWFAYAIFIWVATIIISTIAEQIDLLLFYIADVLAFLALMFIPVSISIAVLRYRLYDIDLLTNRTLVYAVLTVGAVLGYVLIVTGLGALLPMQSSSLSGLAATGLIAVLFQPLRVQVQRAINRLLYGDRDEPYAALTRLGGRLEATLAPDAVLPTLVQTVAEALRLPYVAITLPTSAERPWTVAAAHGTPIPLALCHTVALSYHSEPIGQLLLAPRRGAAFTAADQRLLRELARQAGAAVHAVQLTSALHTRMAELRSSRERLVTAQEEERRRIQRDLHDGLGPVLASMRFRLEACLDHAQASAPELAAELERLDELVGQASTDIRRLVHDLRPPALDQIGLMGALQQHIARVRRETGLHVQLDAALDAPLSAASEVTIYRIVQEALVNVHKHARATAVTVRMERLGNALLLHVQDNGIGGAREGQHANRGHGLAGMRERAELLHGTLVLRSRPESGTTLELYLPLRGEHDDDESTNR